MWAFKKEKFNKREQGVLTVEASVVLVTMLLLVLFLLSFARVYRAQSMVSHAVLQATDAIALESYLRESAFNSDKGEMTQLANKINGSTSVSADNFISLRSVDLPTVAEDKFSLALSSNEGAADRQLKEAGVKGGLKGVDFSNSRMDLEKNDVILFADYTIELQFPVFGITEMKVTKAAKAKTFGEIQFMIQTVSADFNTGSATGGGNYNYGTQVQISATPNYGYRFVKWDDGNASNPRTVTVTGPKTYTAIFTQDNFGVTAKADPTSGGTVSGGGTYTYLQSVQLNAAPKAGYSFSKWTIYAHKDRTTSVEKKTQISLVMDQNYTATASFSKNSYQVSVRCEGISGNYATATAGYHAGTSLKLTYGSSFRLSATKVSGYDFVGWKEEGANGFITTAYAINRTVPAKNVTYVAVYNVKPSISISGGSVEANSTTFKATTTPPNVAVKWRSSNSRVLTVNNGVATAVGDGVATITASFDLNGKTYTSNSITVYVNKSIKIEHYCRRDSGKVRHYYKTNPGPNYSDKAWAPPDIPGVWHREYWVTWSELMAVQNNGHTVGNNHSGWEKTNSQNLFKRLQGTNALYKTQWGYNETGETGYVINYNPYYGMFFVTEYHAPKSGGGYHDFYISSITY